LNEAKACRLETPEDSQPESAPASGLIKGKGSADPADKQNARARNPLAMAFMAQLLHQTVQESISGAKYDGFLALFSFLRSSGRRVEPFRGAG